MLSPDARPVRAYYAALARYDAVGAAHEQAVKTAFHDVLQAAAGGEWTLVPEFTPPGKRVRYDGALRDAFGFTLGYWEAKDEGDDLEREVQKKIARGYSLQNTLFQAPARALLYQDGRLVLDADLTRPADLADVLAGFVGYRAPEIGRFHQAVAEFKTRIPDLAAGLVAKIESARQTDPDFRAAFEAFLATCREAINPNLRAGAVEEMLVQHLLTERLVRTVFDNPDFARKNAIADEIERVVAALTAKHFSRTQFLGQLDRYYRAIEDAAAGITDFAEKQAFLNTVYEQFFQGFSDRVADTHGIVYTPQPLVDFMVRSVSALLGRHFSDAAGAPQSLASPGVHVLDPFVGTGNFLVRVVEQIPALALPAKFKHELHANEVMLLPYYIASLNVEHAYAAKTGRYEAFEGIVLVDTFEMVEGKTVGMFSAENSARAERQRTSPITVIVGNPPYNAHQVNANDANANRKYPLVDGRVSETYAASSRAQNKNALSDPYVKAFRWASDRLGDAGIVALVTNGSFVDDLSFDGMRRQLVDEFDEVWVVDLGGNVRKNPRLSGTTHNVFGIQVGVAITFLVRTSGRRAPGRRATLRYIASGPDWRKEQKLDWLADAGDLDGLDWRTLEPNDRGDWLTDDFSDEWDDFLPLGSSGERASDAENETTLFDQFSRGVETGRDAWVYDFDRDALEKRVERLVDTYNAQVVKWQRKGGATVRLEDVITSDDREIKWTRGLKQRVEAGHFLDANLARIRPALYRPFVSKWLYFEAPLVYLPGQFPSYFPSAESRSGSDALTPPLGEVSRPSGRDGGGLRGVATVGEHPPTPPLRGGEPPEGGSPESIPAPENRVICITDRGSEKPFMALMTDRPGDLHVVGAGASTQCFPLYVYRPDGSKQENVTDWALAQARAASGDAALTKRDLFHAAYAVLHHPAYRARYAADLRRTLPRLPPLAAARALADAGQALAELHVGFETAPAYPLRLVHTPGVPLDAPLERMRWLDPGKTALRLTPALVLEGVPAEAHGYRLGTRSALDWLVDQVRVKADARSGIVHDPNGALPPEALAALVRRVTTVSVETVRLVGGLPDLGLPGA